jgi:hypothetical protein
VHAFNTGVIQSAAGLGGLEPPKRGNSPSAGENFYFLSSKLNVRLILVYSHRLGLTGNGWRYLMAKNSNEGVLGSSATIDRLSTGDSVDLRKIVLQSFFGALSTIAKRGLEVEIEAKK